MTPPVYPDRILAVRLARLLSTGTGLACLLVSLGLLAGMRHGSPPTAMRDLLVRDLLTRDLLWGGTGLIILLPGLRVIAMLLAFTRRREWRYAAAAAFVLLAILAGCWLGLSGAAAPRSGPP